ncbi:tetratricopeptide repeat protein [Roseimaritima sediminicola]|uniref:tetratricopeptide repeat protein n=1 Tax=Roseimaritima sediminicola TaxID=2662066 RepID=UPI0012983197|nr:hypothetical protein [Roseimaritima sediminicola]
MTAVANAQPAPAPPPASSTDPMLSMLYERVQRDPTHADSWRLIGKLQARGGNPTAATDALMRALEIDSHSAATHFDLGQLLWDAGDTASAQTHFQRCVAIAPHSDYARRLREAGRAPPLENGAAATPVAVSSDVAYALAERSAGATEDEPLKPVGYEIQTFDGADDLDRRLDLLRSDADPTLKRLRVFLETGMLYNSNVSLTPISRELADADAESFQGFLNPELEYVAFRREVWRGGGLLRGYFSVNESSQSEFDLASFQPGAFLERDFQVGSSEWIGRLEHVYSLDLLGGDRFGDRHSVTASMIMIRPDLDVIYTYFTAAFSQFDQDGIDPQVNSLDGQSYTGGISRFFQTGNDWLPTYSLGMDLEAADTEGSDYRYWAASAHGDVTCQLAERWSLITTVGVGHRDYYDFTGPVSRDELTWRVHTKLRWQVSDAWSWALVAGHDRFASDNEDFDAERTEGGILATLNY